MALKAPEAGASLLELLLSILFLGAICSSTFGAVRGLGALYAKERNYAQAEATRTILKHIFSEAIVGASQYLPESLYAIDNDSNLFQAETQSKVLTVVEAYPKTIFQRQRLAGAQFAFCAVQSPLPELDGSSSELAIGVGVSSQKILRIHEVEASTQLASCSEGKAIELKYEEAQTPLLQNQPEEQIEAIIPVRDLYSLYLDKNSSLRRYSFATGEHQTVLNGVSKLELESDGVVLKIKFRLEASGKAETILLPLLGHNQVEWLDLIW